MESALGWKKPSTYLHLTKMKAIKFLIYFLFLIISPAILTACMDDNLFDNEVVEGKETAISLKVKIPEMTVVTRGEMAPGADSELNTLWVGIFSAGSGKCTYAGFYTPEASEEHGVRITPDGFYELKDIVTESGMAYIVAVGNPEFNDGIVNGEEKDLSTYLPASKAEAQSRNFNWNTYQQIAVKQLAVADIATPVNNLLMSGIYTDFKESQTGHAPNAWEEANFTSTAIPVSTTEAVELGGAIHLRRLISQVKFNISAADFPGTINPNEPTKDGRRIVSISPRYFQVVNVPYLSWLHEHKSPDANANAGDHVKVSKLNYDSGSLPFKANYRSSVRYSGSQYITGSDEAGYSFDFWMLENKQRAPVNISSYDERERELKTAEGLNSGIYTALCGTSGVETMNNCATFVQINCNIEYLEAGLNTLPGIERRSGEVTYTIHLGGIGNNWSDFNHRRNHKYTYNIKVVDVDKIIVEAEQDEEITPGAEGVVTDVTNPPMEVDAHFNVMNIRLSNLERTGGSMAPGKYEEGKFPFRIEVYDGNNNRHIIDEENFKQYNELYYNWVEFRPTSSKDVIAEYKPMTGTYADGKTFRIEDLTNLQKYPGYNGNTNPDDETEQWYTVFVNEYVYEDKLDENANNWVDYVNKPNRLCWLHTQSGISTDKESIHIVSKYCITQKSIQTFYDIPGDRNVRMDAIGLEHVNEVFGMNIRWALGDQYPDLSGDNGRTNQVDHSRGKRWVEVLDQTQLQIIEDINTNAFQYHLYQDLTEGPYYVPKVNNITYDDWGGYQHVDPARHNINRSKYVVILDACMNRNRDLNGNGVIDIEEVRWYVPSSSELIDMVLGRNSLTTPLMDYNRNDGLYSPQNTGTANPHHANTRFHYVSSNRRALWAEEGVTVNGMPDAYWTDNWNLPAQNLRCVRALGTNLAQHPDGNITPAFTVDNESNPTRIYPTYYETKNMRSYSASVLPPHQETSALNRLCFGGFEFSKELIPFDPNQTIIFYDSNEWNSWEVGRWNVTDGNGYFYHNDNISNLQYHDMILNQGNAKCQAYGQQRGETGWRMPNMKEAALIRLALNNAGLYYHRDRDNYQIGNFLTVTFREFGIGGDNLRSNPNGFYTGVYYRDGEDIVNGAVTGRTHCVTGNDQAYHIRCVRDIR